MRSVPARRDPKFILQNALDFSQRDLHKTFQEWGKKYNSGIVHATAICKHFVAVNDLDIAEELFEHGATVYNDRPDSAVAKMIGWAGYNIALFPYGETTAVIGHLLYLLAEHPEVQKKAQEELDQYIGPPAPGSVPDAISEDDDYKGYLLPKGAVIWGNIWALTHDESKYSDPYTFKPERFLDEDGKLNEDSRVLAYGFGRRICVGKAVGSSTMWLVIACFLACFNIGLSKDEKGRPIPIKGDLIDKGGIT
ncbi:cytochrome P450 [Crepidotus variabilis]|uniref:Cytochrome P450 n=1 Tax=Crepidotus variabilis TaxID=179855 RepID=A0A9P6ETA5_9AGAR|nr:cytochrome P450 [Crepidotus variabilis]